MNTSQKSSGSAKQAGKKTTGIESETEKEIAVTGKEIEIEKETETETRQETKSEKMQIKIEKGSGNEIIVTPVRPARTVIVTVIERAETRKRIEAEKEIMTETEISETGRRQIEEGAGKTPPVDNHDRVGMKETTELTEVSIQALTIQRLPQIPIIFLKVLPTIPTETQRERILPVLQS
jgi:hypothetical protein